MCITKIYICSNETTNSKGHTHLAALSGRKERLLEAGHCCARISVVGSSFFRLTRCERFRNFVRGGFSTFAKRYDFLSTKRQLSPPTIWVLYIHEKMDQSKVRRRLEATAAARSVAGGTIQYADFKVRRYRRRRAVSRAQRRCADVAQRRERPRSLQSTNVRRKDDKKGVMMTSYNCTEVFFLDTIIARQIRKFEYRK